MPPDVGDIAGFEWLDWVVDKITRKHGVDPAEVEECFENQPYFVRRLNEGKYALLGRSTSGRYLFVVFAWRGWYVRVISARDMTDSERTLFRRK